MSSVRQIRAQGRLLVISGLIFCFTLAAFALSPWFLPGVALLVAVGIASTVFTTMIATMIQLRVPGELRGRVISLYAITLIGLPSLGALGVAAVAQSLGGQIRTGWARLAGAVLDVLGVNPFTSRLGAAAGAPRAVVLGALILLLVIVVMATRFRGIQAPAERGEAAVTQGRPA
jgi:MFS family permease